MRVDYKFPKYPRISPECKDLIQRILVGEPERRLSIREIQEHPWCAAREWRRLQRRAAPAPVNSVRVSCSCSCLVPYQSRRAAPLCKHHKPAPTARARARAVRDRSHSPWGHTSNAEAAVAAVLGLARCARPTAQARGARYRRGLPPAVMKMNEECLRLRPHDHPGYQTVDDIRRVVREAIGAAATDPDELVDDLIGDDETYF